MTMTAVGRRLEIAVVSRRRPLFCDMLRHPAAGINEAKDWLANFLAWYARTGQVSPWHVERERWVVECIVTPTGDVLSLRLPLHHHATAAIAQIWEWQRTARSDMGLQLYAKACANGRCLGVVYHAERSIGRPNCNKVGTPTAYICFTSSHGRHIFRQSPFSSPGPVSV